MKIEEILGNEKVKQILKKTVQNNNILHSYLFIGEEGIGKSIFAKEFAKMILCTGEQKPCCYCKSCIELEQNNQPDYLEILPDGNSIKIEQIRNMQLKVFEKPIISNKKVYVIKDAEKMTKEAQNALLKTLEEPPEYITIILIANNESSILNTIKSRCTKISFEPLSKDELKEYLKRENNQTNISDELLEISMGSITKLKNVIQKQDMYINIYNCIKALDKVSLLDFLEKAEFLSNLKEDSNEVLELILGLIFKISKEKSDKKINYLHCVEIVDNVKKNLLSNSNYDMQIDNMLIKLWEEVNEKSYWS